MKKNGILKKLVMAFAALLGLLLVAAIVVPLVVDVDKYRPQIVSAANERINGKLELGKLQLSLWGQVRIEIAGMTLTDPSGAPLVSVKDAFFHLPFFSIFSGSPALTLKMTRPSVNVVKDRAGKLNLMNVMKADPQAAASAAGGTAAAPAQGSTSLPAIATRARLGIEMRQAQVTYKDLATGLDTQVKDLNLLVRDLSLNRPTELELWADLDTKLGKTFMLKGPIRLTGQATPTVSGGKIEKVALKAKLDADGLEMQSPGAFYKQKGMAANADLSVNASEKEAKIETFVFKFFNAEVKASGLVTNLGGGAGTSPSVALTVQSNEIDFKPWSQLLPSLKDFDLGGSAKLDADANGPADKLGYKGKLEIKGLTAKAPKLKEQPRIDGVVSFVTDQLDNVQLTMKAPGNDLAIRGKMTSLAQARGEFEIFSNSLDLDKLVEFPPPGKKAEAAPAEAGTGTSSEAGSAKSADYDAMLAPLRENKMLQSAAIGINVNLKLLKAYDIRMTQIVSRISLRDLVAGVEKFSMNLWNGSIGMTASIQLKPRTPQYRFNAKVAGLDLGEAVRSQMQFMKNTVIGKASFEIAGDGASFNPAPAKSNLKAKGGFKVEHATFTTIDIAKMINDGLTKAIDQVGNKIPAVKGKKLGLPAGGGSKYDLISTDFTIAGGQFAAPNFVAKATANQGIDLKGNTAVGLNDYSLKAAWEVIDTYNLTKAKDLSVDVAGTQVPHILAEGNGPLRLPIDVGCTLTAPCYSYNQVPEFLIKVAMGNLANAGKARVTSEVKNHAQDLIKKNLPGIGDKLKGLFR